ncbi:MAG: DNA helicase RecQ [Candidatus Kuenenia sp.]|nr:DNA helicase RecQ [Candidatus Kuenenia hertensis]
MDNKKDSIYPVLHKYFGYSKFYPLQEDIIRWVLGRKDLFVLMPTGGGKSLCYQLPALLFDGITVVVSPLIALMKDQVDGLIENGISAAFINSSLRSDGIVTRKKELAEGKTKILYIAPERLAMPEFIRFLQGLKVSLFAIDESHCISEWGHDFRPEYRQLSMLRQHFPKTPIMALTATATPSVQRDIIEQLKLTDYRIFTASFNRKNLFYQIIPKDNPYHQILCFLKERKKESGIVYCQGRKTVEHLAESLQNDGYRALPYHAGLSAEMRTENQERFIREDVEIIVATIAFGMGIDKPNIRYVIHYDLPKSIEGYYQETGRAGRDGLKSDCILLFSYADKMKIEYFIRQKEDENEKHVAYKQLREIVSYCESNVCRRRILLDYFGEKFSEHNCGNCDLCLNPKEQFDGTVIAQKLLSCVYRVGECFGMHYVIDVLLGSKNQKVLQNGHTALSTYGIGKEYSKPQWLAFSRELIQSGYLSLDGEKYPVLKLNKQSREILLGRKKVFLTKPEETPSFAVSKEDTNYDQALYERLRVLRKSIADRESMPPYIIFHDTSLKEMSTRYPQTASDLEKISGVGELKLRKYGALFLKEICDYCRQHAVIPKQDNFKQRAFAEKQTRTPTIYATLELCKNNLSLQEIAGKRGLATSTISTHLEKLILGGEDVSIDKFVDPGKQQHIRAAIEKLGVEALSPVKELLGEGYSYDEIKLVRAEMMYAMRKKETDTE